MTLILLLANVIFWTRLYRTCRNAEALRAELVAWEMASDEALYAMLEGDGVTSRHVVYPRYFNSWTASFEPEPRDAASGP